MLIIEDKTADVSERKSLLLSKMYNHCVSQNLFIKAGEKMKTKSLARQFSVLFILFAIVTTVISGIISYVNQTTSYHEDVIVNLEKFTRHMSGIIQKEGSELADIKDWLDEHDYKLNVPMDFSNDLSNVRNAFYSYIQKNYDYMPTYREMDEEAKRLYVTYRYEYWLCVFRDSAEEFKLNYVYFISPIEGEDHKVRYVLDATFVPETGPDGTEILQIGDVVYEDPSIHHYMWETWETGSETKAIDSLNNEYGYMYTYCFPLIIDGEKIGLICADTSVDHVNSMIFNSVFRQAFAAALIFAVATIVLFRFLYTYIFARIQRLENNVEEYANTKNPNLAKKISEEKGQYDELGSLSERFAEMVNSLEEYMVNLQKVTKEKERIGAELNVATQIQADMLPRVFPAFPNRKDFDIYATMAPAKEVGGDFYDFFLTDDKHLALVIADVSGKGVPAALFMVIAKTLIKNRMQMGELPAQALMNVNNQLCEGNEAELFVTVWLALIDLETGHVIEANAGHEYPAIRRSGECFELVKTKHSPAVATFEGIKFRQDEFDLNPGDSLFVYTDGVTEATNSNNELFGEERLLTSINKNKNSVPVEILPELRKDIDEFVGTAPQFDDITMMGFKFLGTNGANQSE